MKLPKARITLDLDHDLLEWVMRKVQETKNSRNEIIGRCIRLAKEAAEERPRPDTYQVMPGDTIWSIYATYYKGCDWDEVRYKIGQANGLKNDRLYPYEVITLPEVP